MSMTPVLPGGWMAWRQWSANDMERIPIQGVGSELQGVGRLPDGRAVFVPGALPEEVVEVELRREARRYCEGRLLRIVEASPERVPVDCPYDTACGGCVARHMRYAYTLALKRRRVLDAFERIGGFAAPMVAPTIASPEVDHYRNKAEYGVELRDGSVHIGPQEARSHRVVPVRDCRLQKPESLHALCWLSDHLGEYAFARQIRQLVTRVSRSGKLAVVLAGDAPPPRGLSDMALAMAHALPELLSFHYCQHKPHPTHALDGSCVRIYGRETLQESLLGLSFELSPLSFFQINTLQAETLYRKAMEAIGLGEEGLATEAVGAPRQEGAPGPSPQVLDAYCGAGTITLAAAARGARCVGVEIVAPAVEDARHNAQRNGLDARARFLCGDVAEELPRLLAEGRRFDAAILDPPRKGAAPAVLHALADAAIPRIAYVSCDPATLARDCKLLAARGYVLHSVQPVDMFPWTAHVETVVQLARS